MENTQTLLDEDKTIISKKIDNTNDHIAQEKLIGKCFNERYLIESKIGTGGMSDVYRAIDLHLKNAGIEEPYVAIKILQTQFASMEDAQQILINEALQTQKLSHPNIIRVYDVNSDGQYYFMVMEWLDGESLDQIISSSKPIGISFQKTQGIFSQIGAALSYAHENGLVHTDLKPSNIFLTRKGQIKIFDFGVARSLQINEDEYAIQNKSTSTALNGHTPAYASLEQLNGGVPCPQDDIFAFSCIIYELLTSKHPYNRVAANKVDLTKGKSPKPKNISLNHWFALKKGLALKKIDRVDNVDELIASLSTRLFPKIAASVAILAICGFAGNTYYQQHMQINALTQRLDKSDQHIEKIENYETLSASELLQNIDQISTDNAFAAQSLLRQHQQDIIDIFDDKIKNAPTVGDGKYKDYAAVNALIAEANNYYPDSLRLQKLQTEQVTARATIVTALIEKLDQLLQQGRYDETGDDSIESLLKDLSIVVPEEQYVATSDAFKLFEKNFNKALAKKDYQELNSLIKVGDLVFYNYKGAEDIIAKSKEMASAVNQLTAYEAYRKKSPGNAIFPYSAAATFYKQDIDKLEQKLSVAQNYNTFMEIDSEIANFAKKFPKNFTPLVALQKQEASYLFTYANKLMEIRSFARAKILVKRGNVLLKDLEDLDTVAVSSNN
ncbi:serine/threonine-protein kinase [Psychromonas sp. PT13]|uniref:serine/threonine-protein kinase n=1 Tax=Psychromonas sp. PT13 TaxID=3439547 RepID=UPI003EBCFDF9